MLIQKFFHLRQPLSEAHECLRRLGNWDASEDDIEVHCTMAAAQGIGRFEFQTRNGNRICADIRQLPGDEPNRILFRSVGGNLEMAGMVELFEVRPNLTEVALTLEYVPVSPLQKAFSVVDRFLNRQLARVEGCMERPSSALS